MGKDPAVGAEKTPLLQPVFFVSLGIGARTGCARLAGMLPKHHAVLCLAETSLKNWLWTVLNLDHVEVSVVEDLGRVMELATGRERDLFVLDGREPGIDNVLALLAAAQPDARVLVFGADDAVHERDPRVLRLPWSTDRVDFLAPIRRSLAAPKIHSEEMVLGDRKTPRARRISGQRIVERDVGLRPPREGPAERVDVAKIEAIRARRRVAG